MFDWMRMDARVAELVARRRVGAEPIDDRLLSARLRNEIRSHDDPLAQRLVAWLDELTLDRDSWPEHASLAMRWRETHVVAHQPEPMSPADLRAAMLGSPDERGAEQHARALLRLAEPVGDAAFGATERRFEIEQTLPLPTNGWREAIDAAAAAFAAALLQRSDDVAGELARPGGLAWLNLLRSAVGKEANEGWPARLTTRWLHGVVDPSGMTAGLRLAPFRLPAVWGASSFGRALGALGSAALQASRPLGMPFVVHQRPDGLRHARRRALLATMIGSAAFARRVLSLGRDRAREHCRRVAAAQLAWLRVRALGALLLSAARRGETQGREVGRELSFRVFGEPTPHELIGALPGLSRHGSVALLGAHLAGARRAALVEVCDEDWFHNPRTGGMLRDQDAAADEVGEAVADAGEANARRWADTLVGELEMQLG